MSEGFYKLEKLYLEYVKTGCVTPEEFGLFCALALMINPHNGYWLGSFSSFALEMNIKPAKARYILDKLREQRWIYFETSQGERGKVRFFVMNYSMVTPKGQQTRKVTPQYIAKIAPYLEVEEFFEKFSNDVTNC